jgi:glucokinase
MGKQGVVAVDLGGTNVRLGLVTAGGKVLRRRRIKMRTFSAKDGLLAWLAEAIDGFLSDAGPAFAARAVAIGFAGPTDSRAGRVYYAPNVGRLAGIEVASGLRRLVGLRVVVENDANCAALGEYWLGAGRGAKSLFLFTVGTGIGGSFVVDGKVWRGHDGIAGEIGHTVVMVGGPRCSCGKRGCLEALVSATAIVRDYRAALRPGRAGRAPRVAGAEAEPLEAKEVFERARSGDRRARQVIDCAARALGIGIANVFHLLNPEVILVGGGVSRAGAALLGPATEEARSAVFGPLRGRLRVRRTSLGDDAGMLGAAYLALDRRRI